MSVYNIHLLSFSHFCYIFYDFILFLDESNRFISRSLKPLVNANQRHTDRTNKLILN